MCLAGAGWYVRPTYHSWELAAGLLQRSTLFLLARAAGLRTMVLHVLVVVAGLGSRLEVSAMSYLPNMPYLVARAGLVQITGFNDERILSHDARTRGGTLGKYRTTAILPKVVVVA